MAKVVVGFFSFTEVTDPTEHRSYNEWHQLDHMPEQYTLEGIVFGQRWVSTRACRRARVYDDPALAPIHYMTLYLMSEPVDTTLEQFRALGESLRRADRFFEHRRSRLSGPFTVTDKRAAPRVQVSAEAIPYRPNRGIYVVVRSRIPSPDAVSEPPVASSGTGDDAQPRLAGALVDTEGVAGVWTFATDPRSDRHGWHPGEKNITVCYLDEDPLTVAPQLDRLVQGPDGTQWGVPLLAGPLETITPWCWDWFDEGA